MFPIADGQVGIYGTHRPHARGVYEPREAQAVAEFVPHLQRALQIRKRLAESALERRAGIEALERTGTATLVVGQGARILYANAQADALLRQGEALRAIGGRLVTTSRRTSDRIASLIDGAIATASGHGGTPGGAVAIGRVNRLPVTLLVAPIRPVQGGLGGTSPAAIVFIRDPEQLSPSKAALRELFGLSPAEAYIAGGLADGKSLEQIAGEHRISLNTVRTQLKAVFVKTETRRQAELGGAHFFVRFRCCRHNESARVRKRREADW